MATHLNPPDDLPKLFNPMMLWTDMSMRALEMTLSSSQTMGDRLDRLTRAGANTEVQEAAAKVLSGPGDRDRSGFAPSSGLALAAQMQRAGLELMTQVWQQWMSGLGTLTALGVGRPVAEAVRQLPLLTARPEFASRSTDQTAIVPAARGGSSGGQGGRAREKRAEEMEHAFAKAGPKRRSGAGRAKSKARSRSS